MNLAPVFTALDSIAPYLLALGAGLLIGCLLAYALGKFSKEEARASIVEASQGDTTILAKFEEAIQVIDEIAA